MQKNTMRTLLALSLSVPIIGCADAQTTEGARTFTQRCAKCHSAEKLKPELVKEPLAGREALLQQYLKGHYPPPAASKDALVAYLIAISTDKK